MYTQKLILGVVPVKRSFLSMEEAVSPVKEAADYVTVADNNHDGVAEAIEKFIF